MAQFSGKHWSTALYDHIPVAMISVDKEGTIWTIRDGDGVYRYKNGTAEQLFKTVPSSDREISMGTNVRSLTFDKENIPWIGTGLGIKKYINGAWVNDSTVIKFLSTKNSDSKLPGVLVNMLSFDRSGTLWAGTVKGLVQCSSGGCTLYDTTGSVLPDNTVQCIAFDTNNVWVGTKGGLVKLGSDPSNHLTYTAANSALRDNDITAIAFTKNGDLWTGTRLGGLTRFLASSIASSPSVSVLSKHHNQFPPEISYTFLSGRSCKIMINIGHPAVNTFTLLSIDGKTIRTFNNTHSGKTSIVWDGLDKYNRPVSGGLYLGVLKERGKIVNSRILPMP
jgi:ligand-binding sensor domain-containing protein